MLVAAGVVLPTAGLTDRAPDAPLLLGFGGGGGGAPFRTVFVLGAYGLLVAPPLAVAVAVAVGAAGGGRGLAVAFICSAVFVGVPPEKLLKKSSEVSFDMVRDSC